MKPLLSQLFDLKPGESVTLSKRTLGDESFIHIHVTNRVFDPRPCVDRLITCDVAVMSRSDPIAYGVAEAILALREAVTNES